MSSSASVLIVGSVGHEHPAGQRRRGGVVFFSRPTAHFVTPEAAKLIQDDPAIRKHRRLSSGWFQGIGFEFSETNLAKFKEKDPSPKDIGKDGDETGQETANASKSAQKAVSVKNAAKAQKNDKKKASGKPVGKMKMTVSVKDCIAALESKGLVAGKDFAEDAPRKDLVNLYNSL